MAKIRNATGEDRLLPWLGDRLVLDGQVVDVADEDVWAYTQQDGWEPADGDAEQLTQAAEAIYIPPSPVDASTPEPAGNASREEWVAWVVGRELATLDELDGLGRDQIRHTYRTTTEES